MRGGLSVKKKVRGGLIRHTECEGGVFASGASEKITPVNMLLCQFLVSWAHIFHAGIL